MANAFQRVRESVKSVILHLERNAKPQVEENGWG